jgi:hypothetical protein
MNKKKIGLLALALVLALGALGVGYAAWTDTIFITGTVETGSVDLEIIDTSNTWILKVPDHGIEIWHTWDSQEPEVEPFNGDWFHSPPAIPISKSLIAWADADKISDNEIVGSFGNAFPCAELTADCLIHYAGSVPAMVSAEITGSTDLTDNGVNDCDLLAPYVVFAFYEWDETTGQGDEITACAVQMHYCDYVYCVMTLDLPQADELDPQGPYSQEDFMNLGCEFTAQINAIQWNEG